MMAKQNKTTNPNKQSTENVFSRPFSFYLTKQEHRALGIY